METREIVALLLAFVTVAAVAVALFYATREARGVRRAGRRAEQSRQRRHEERLRSTREV